MATQEGGSRSVSGPEGEVGGGAVCRWASLYVQVGARFEAKCGGIGRWIINSVHVTVDLHTSVSAYIFSAVHEEIVCRMYCYNYL